MSIRLSDFLRQARCAWGTAALSGFSEEGNWRWPGHYIDVEQVRFGDEAARDGGTIEGGCGDLRSAAATEVQPMVEDAIKHGIARWVERRRNLHVARGARATACSVIEKSLLIPEAGIRRRGNGIAWPTVRNRLYQAKIRETRRGWSLEVNANRYSRRLIG